jgi:Flp pilus assembly pilin Flp
MQDIAIRLVVALQNLPARLRDEEEGQTAVEYAGILAVIALIFVALFKLELGDKIAGAIGDALKTITHKDG